MSALETAREAWGAEIPDWIEALARECDRTSQGQAAKALERSASLVSTVLRCRYPGDMETVEKLVRGTFMKETVSCPVKGEIGLQVCLKWQQRARNFENVNAEYVLMYRACNRCPLHRAKREVEA